MKTVIKAEALEPCLAIKEGVTREGTTRRCNIGGKKYLDCCGKNCVVNCILSKRIFSKKYITCMNQEISV